MTPTTQASAAPKEASAPILSYDVPQEISYSGQNLIQLQLGASYFIASSGSQTAETRS
jgi:hypothetical protein